MQGAASSSRFETAPAQASASRFCTLSGRLVDVWTWVLVQSVMTGNKLAFGVHHQPAIQGESSAPCEVTCSTALCEAQEEEIRSWLEKAGEIKGLRLNRDKATKFNLMHPRSLYLAG